jgi:hypothetical protein
MVSLPSEVSTILLCCRDVSDLILAGYYNGTIPGITQKDVSSTLTKIWHKDPFKQRWGLIARVWTLIRDEVANPCLWLNEYLRVACPAMCIIKPEDYLVALNWTITKSDGNTIATQDGGHTTNSPLYGFGYNQRIPTTEMELLNSCLAAGYASQHAEALTKKVASNANAVMTTDSVGMTFEVTTSPELDFANTVAENPVTAAAALMGVSPTDTILSPGVDVVTVEDVYDITSVSQTISQGQNTTHFSFQTGSHLENMSNFGEQNHNAAVFPNPTLMNQTPLNYSFVNHHGNAPNSGYEAPPNAVFPNLNSIDEFDIFDIGNIHDMERLLATKGTVRSKGKFRMLFSEILC